MVCGLSYLGFQCYFQENNQNKEILSESLLQNVCRVKDNLYEACMDTWAKESLCRSPWAHSHFQSMQAKLSAQQQSLAGSGQTVFLLEGPESKTETAYSLLSNLSELLTKKANQAGKILVYIVSGVGAVVYGLLTLLMNKKIF